MKKIFKALFCIACLMTLCVFMLAGCDSGNKTYTVSFEVDGEILGDVTTEGNSAIELPVDPSKDGFDFGGWYYDKDEWQKPFTANSLEAEPITSNLTVYARWVNKVYDVTFVADGKIIKTENVPSGGSATAPEAPEKTGYTFTGWDKEFNNVVSELTVTAQYEANVYTVTLNKNGADSCEELTEYAYGVGATLPVPERAGYGFGGWFESEEFEGEAVTAISKTDTGAKTYYAKWVASAYDVTFIADGKIIKTENVPSGGSATAPEAPEKTGYTFTGWDKKFDNVVSELTVTAQYEANVYTVTLHDNNADSCGELTAYTYGVGATLPVPERAGHTFGGWYESENFEGEKVTEITATDTGAKTYYAKFTANVYTVTLNNNGADSCEELTEYTYGAGATLPVPEKAGHTFGGWYESEEFEGEKVTEITATDTGAKTFYAKWTVLKYTVRFINADGSELQNGEVEYGSTPAYTGETPVLNAGGKYEYAFAGWNKEIATVTEGALYIATYTKTERQLYTCTYNDSFTEDHIFTETALKGDGEWTVELSVKNFYNAGGIMLLSDTGSKITLVNNYTQTATYMQFDGGNTKGYQGSTAKGGMIEFTLNFRLVKLNGTIRGFIDGRDLGAYTEAEAADMFGEHTLTLSTFRSTANTGNLTFKVSANPFTAIAGNTACTDKFEGISAVGNFTFTAAVQGTGLYTYAGIRIQCGESWVNFYSHTYGGNTTIVGFANDGWNGNQNSATVLASVNLQNSEKGTYKFVKTSEKALLYLNETLIFEFDMSFALSESWGEEFFKEGAVYTFGQYVEAGAGGSGYYCDTDIEYETVQQGI